MANSTYFVVVPMSGPEHWDHAAPEPIKARFQARALAEVGKGSVACSSAGDPDLGELPRASS